MYVKPDVPESLISLMESYANMLLVLRTTVLPDDKFFNLKCFLSDFCNVSAIRQCSTLHDVIDLLKEHLKIYLFNIDALNVSCKHFNSSDVISSVQQYRRKVSQFLSNTSIIELKGILRTKIVDSTEVETVTIKLDESRTEDTLEALRKLICHLFGNHHKALIHFRTDEGCVRVTWLVTTTLVPILREKAEQLSPEYLASKGVLELVIGLRIAPNEGLAFNFDIHVHAIYMLFSFYITAVLSDHNTEASKGAVQSKNASRGKHYSSTEIARKHC